MIHCRRCKSFRNDFKAWPCAEALSQMFTEAQGFAYEAFSNTAASAAAQGAAAARMLKSSFGMESD